MSPIIRIITAYIALSSLAHAENVADLKKKRDIVLQSATLCDFAADYNGKLVISGTFDSLTTATLPVVHPECSLALRFYFTPRSAGSHKLSINIVNEEGKSIDPDHMPLEPGFQVKIPEGSPFMTRNFIMNLQGLSFSKAEVYSVDIRCDGEFLMSLPIQVVLNAPKNKPAAESFDN